MKLSNYLLLLLFPAVSVAQNKTMVFSGQIKNMPQATIARLRFDGESVNLKADSAIIAADGSFKFEGTVTDPALADLVLELHKPGSKLAQGFFERYIYLEAGTIKLASADSLKNIKIDGSVLNNDFAKIQLATQPASNKITALKKEYYSASQEETKSVDFQNRFKEQNTKLEAEFRALQLNFIKANPQSVVSLDALISYAGMMPDLKEIEPVFNGLSAKVKNSPNGKRFADEIARTKITAIGNLAPDFTLPDTSGKPVSLHDFKGKYVLVDFWASWCGPCRKQNPNVVNAYNKFKQKGFTVLGVSLDRANGKTAWLNAIKTDGLAWTQVSDLKFWDSDAAKKYNIKAIPQNFLIDPTGKIVARDLTGTDLESKLSEVFKD